MIDVFFPVSHMQYVRKQRVIIIIQDQQAWSYLKAFTAFFSSTSSKMFLALIGTAAGAKEW